MACGTSDNTEFIRKGSCPIKREMNNMKNSQTTAGQKPQTVPARVLREQLCQRAMEASQQLPRSVGRLTSSDARLPFAAGCISLPSTQWANSRSFRSSSFPTQADGLRGTLGRLRRQGPVLYKQVPGTHCVPGTCYPNWLSTCRPS